MEKKIGKVVYNTETATEIARKTVSFFGDPAGYEEILYQNATGNYFVYGVGGSESKYATEKITAIAKNKVDAWGKEN